MGGSQSEHHRAVVAVKAIRLLCNPCCKPLAHYRHHKHVSSHKQRLCVRQHPHINHHSHAYQEVGNEQGIAHKLYAAHQRRHIWYVAVEHQSGKERSKHGLKPDHLRHPRCEEHHSEHIHKLGDLVAIILEEPSREAGIAIQHHAAVDAEAQQ